MNRNTKLTLALGAFFVVAALLISACGSSSKSKTGAAAVPATDAAIVAGNPITKRALLHWMYIDAKGQSAQQPGAPVIVPEDPPTFAKCIAQVRAQIPTLAKAKAATIRSDCSQLFTSLSGQVMDFLIKGYWYQATAHKLGVKLTPAELTKAINQQKKLSGLTTAAKYKQFLTQSGYTSQDISYRVRVSTVYEKLLKRHPTNVTSAEIASYYAKHKSSYGSPVKLNMRIVLAKTAGKANAAKSALQGGQGWSAVTKKYSIDPTTKNTGGLLSGVTANEEDAALSKAAFSAPQHKLQGPVKGQFGYYVFEVLKKIPATQETLKQATPAIKQTLSQQKQTNATKAIDTQVQAQWKHLTFCQKVFATTPDCSNYVKPPTPKTATPGSTATTPPATATTPPATKTTPSKSKSKSSSGK